MARRLRSILIGIVSGIERRRWRSVAQRMIVTMGLVFSVVLVQALAGASTDVTMQAPYDRSGFEGSAIGDHLTGVLSASAVSTGPSEVSRAWIEADHQLTADTSSIDYVVDLERADADASFSAKACGGGYCSQSATESLWLAPNWLDPSVRQRLAFTFAPPQALTAGTTVTVRVSVTASARPSLCDPDPRPWHGNCSWTGELVLGLAEAVANGQARVASITAAVHHSGDPDITPSPTSSPTVSEIQLDAHGYKEKGLQKADLTWTRASGSSVDVYRGEGDKVGDKIATTDNDGTFTDHIDQRGKGTYTYRVCEAGTTTCSNEATVEF